MIRSINKLGDRLLSRLLPSTTAAAEGCHTEWDRGVYCRVCCDIPISGGVACNSWHPC